ncbi:uncharacterized protein SOCEGT47_043860 [Sorangium cellulosum]|uniref:Uncharacterized protein n=1 Tax=Sorangium cellulosum TaxID=56 RepID=A0A4P2Q497_SORCE|nr:hypothetical protein [Sorangium cellulosum]AUX23856.1 uncharacterized protein SOCEGT47_043860 [Sorangium cellulosum]
MLTPHLGCPLPAVDRGQAQRGRRAELAGLDPAEAAQGQQSESDNQGEQADGENCAKLSIARLSSRQHGDARRPLPPRGTVGVERPECVPLAGP